MARVLLLAMVLAALPFAAAGPAVAWPVVGGDPGLVGVGGACYDQTVEVSCTYNPYGSNSCIRPAPSSYDLFGPCPDMTFWCSAAVAGDCVYGKVPEREGYHLWGLACGWHYPWACHVTCAELAKRSLLLCE